ncbi:SAM-dependent methyltransferase [Rhizobium sp. VS19-DR104.2]|uniref:SAM-dependent methyltransferase n=1 Tax=unclassified Rhizobium TaxID=2613769 RepID=UPI001CC3C1AA|nr:MULTISPECIES: SAM-dependent methyltransferase [unclassified Rhizobium]MBZ5760261.1 SAM-dependent methyltransferase [Rhizobium sp. VS19-DR96]MBZ5766895.1 SAM-dependent methyltransferase [Rhizobium sp. VS19-DR129.2]MBZ5773112.1 SAM-dependent methyltransferase [Rhizobium sp. VS19-DRK62.2]MBZ5784096.1 SAM-dependent methyltransferase [Rhizobium sp. VS19-DR121]MBZ5802456.1 SAM-dependent methyltransferase [Rhizobium sp. VS19-DR181]
MSEDRKLVIPGPRALDILKRAFDSEDGTVRTDERADAKAAPKLNAYRYLTRDKKDGALWTITDLGRQAVASANARPQSEPELQTGQPDIADDVDLPALRADASGLVQTVERARALLDDGDLMAARQLAGGAYLEAKAAAQFASTFGAAGKRLIAKARQLQGDALLIETRAKIRIAAAWDEAQAEGKALKGRPKSISDENTFTQAEAGVSAKDIHDARKLAEAEIKAPGIVERAIQARLMAGLEPSRANLRAAVGTASATQEERGHNLYETPPEAMWTLLALEKFRARIKEPACGRGAISTRLEEAGYTVAISDLVDYGTADKFGEVQTVADFLESEADPEQPDIVTNPPYGELLNRFVAHALRVHRPRKMALLLNINFLCGFEDLEREFAMDDNPPSRIIVFKRRLPMMHRDGWDGPKAASRMNTAWFVWELNEAGIYAGEMRISRVDWKKFVPASTIESEAA